LDDFYVSYVLNVFVSQPGLEDDVKSQMNQQILDVCAERKIEIMSPHYHANREGDRSTIPEIEA
jgi:small-conductance mechanosensitive channel